MSDLPSRADACRLLGCADSELADIFDSPAGVVYVTSDGNSLIDVPAELPDFDGKTGLMFATAPASPGGYKGDFPVFTNPPDLGERDLGIDLSSLTKDELAVHAEREFGITLSTKWSKDRMLEAIAEAQATATAPATAEDGGSET